MKTIDVILLVPLDDPAGRLRRKVLDRLLDNLSSGASSTEDEPPYGPRGGTPAQIRVAQDDAIESLQAHPDAWVIASPAAHPQVMEAARRFPQRVVLLADLAAPLSPEQEDFWKQHGPRLAAVAAVSQAEREEIERRWGLDPDSVIRLGLGLAADQGEKADKVKTGDQDNTTDKGAPLEGQKAPRSQPSTAPGQPFQLDLLQSWKRGRAVVVDAADVLRRELCFEADGGVAVPAAQAEKAREHLRDHPATARQLGLQGRLYVDAVHHPQSSAQTLRRLLQALPARRHLAGRGQRMAGRRLAGRRVAIYTPSFLPYDAVSNYVAETCRLLKGWGVGFSLHVQSDLRREDFADHLRPVSDPDPEADIEIYNYPGYYPSVERLKQPTGDKMRIFDFHGVTPSSLWPDDSLAQSEREIRLARKADRVFTHSLSSRDFLEQEHGVASERMIRFPYSVDLNAFSPRPPDRELLSGHGLREARVLLYVGRMAPNKRIDVLVEGLARLPEDCALILAGDCVYPIYARETDKARALARKLGVESRVVFTGSVSDPELRRLFHSAHLFVSASLHEGFGIPFIEAMACGLPSIGTRTASIPEVIGQAGRTFSPADPDDFASQARTLLEDDAAYLKAAQAGLRQVQLYSRQSLDDNLALALAASIERH